LQSTWRPSLCLGWFWIFQRPALNAKTARGCSFESPETGRGQKGMRRTRYRLNVVFNLSKTHIPLIATSFRNVAPCEAPCTLRATITATRRGKKFQPPRWRGTSMLVFQPGGWKSKKPLSGAPFFPSPFLATPLSDHNHPREVFSSGMPFFSAIRSVGVALRACRATGCVIETRNKKRSPSGWVVRGG